MLLTILANNVMLVPVVPPIPPTPPSGGGGGSYHSTRSRYTWEQQEEDNTRDTVERENKFIIEFLKTATDIINNQ